MSTTEPPVIDAATELVPAPQQRNIAIDIIREAMAAKVDPATLRELLAVRREWEADEARKAYFQAISEFQRRAPIIEKGDDANGRNYARMDRIWRTVRDLFTELGLSATWQVCTINDGICHVEGQLAHVQGHGVALVMDVALPELIRSQNKAQQVGSARTYAQRYAFCAATGLVTGEDDDAESIQRTPTLKEKVKARIADDLANPQAEEASADLLNYFDMVEATEDADKLTTLAQTYHQDLPLLPDQKAARRAINARAAKLRLRWDAATKQFIGA